MPEPEPHQAALLPGGDQAFRHLGDAFRVMATVRRRP